MREIVELYSTHTTPKLNMLFFHQHKLYMTYFIQTLTNKENHGDVSLVLVSIYNGNKEKHSA